MPIFKAVCVSMLAGFFPLSSYPVAKKIYIYPSMRNWSCGVGRKSFLIEFVFSLNFYIEKHFGSEYNVSPMAMFDNIFLAWCVSRRNLQIIVGIFYKWKRKIKLRVFCSRNFIVGGFIEITHLLESGSHCRMWWNYGFVIILMSHGYMRGLPLG